MKIDHEPWFEGVSARCGVPKTRAAVLVRKAMHKTGSAVVIAGADAYRDALPTIEAMLRAYMSDRDATERVRAIRAYLDGEDTASVETTGVVESLRQARKNFKRSGAIARGRKVTGFSGYPAMPQVKPPSEPDS